jgi:beta-glucosidase
VRHGFGFGLSYTTFDIADVSMNAPDGANAPVTRRFLVSTASADTS